MASGQGLDSCCCLSWPPSCSPGFPIVAASGGTHGLQVFVASYVADSVQASLCRQVTFDAIDARTLLCRGGGLCGAQSCCCYSRCVCTTFPVRASSAQRQRDDTETCQPIPLPCCPSGSRYPRLSLCTHLDTILKSTPHAYIQSVPRTLATFSQGPARPVL